MQSRRRGTLVAITLAALAVAIAATGTAVAVTATQVNIADHDTPSRIAHVDSSGRLTTAGQTATLSYEAFVGLSSGGATLFLTSPTSATLAVTRLALSTPSFNDSTYGVQLEQKSASGGSCTASTQRTFGTQFLDPGDTELNDFSSPLIVRAVNPGMKYCLAVVVFYQSGAGTSAELDVHFAGYVASGSYGGIGTSANPGRNAVVGRARR